MKYSLLAVDMDGTLLNSNKKLSPKFYDVFEELKKRNIKDVKAVYSIEEPIRAQDGTRIRSGEEVSVKRSIPGSIAYVPSVVGLIICSEVIKDLTK